MIWLTFTVLLNNIPLLLTSNFSFSPRSLLTVWDTLCLLLSDSCTLLCMMYLCMVYVYGEVSISGWVLLILIAQSQPSSFFHCVWTPSSMALILDCSTLAVYWCMYSGNGLSAWAFLWFLPGLNYIYKLKSDSSFTNRWPVALSFADDRT